MDLSVEHRAEYPTAAVVKVVGHVDGSNYGTLVVEARSLYEAGTRQLILDLSECEYLSSAGLVALHSIIKMLRGEQLPNLDNGWAALKGMDTARAPAGQKQLGLVSPTGRVDRVLDMSGMKMIIPIYRDVDGALAEMTAV